MRYPSGLEEQRLKNKAGDKDGIKVKRDKAGDQPEWDE